METREFIKIVGAGPTASVDMVAELLCESGYAIIPVRPSGKAPLCTLNRNERKAADKAALEAGARDGKHECGVKEYITDPAKARRVVARLMKEHDGVQVNLGIVAHPSRILLVDADNADNVAAFQRDWARASGDDGYLTRSPTVLSPGVQEPDGSWLHKDGGHFYFVLPDGVELPPSPGYLRDQEGGYDLKWGMSQSLVPPSVRQEGPYIPKGDVVEAPAWLIQRALDRVNEHELHIRAKSELVPNDSISEWSIRTPWAEILTPDGWTETFKSDNCGCPIFTRPGGGSTSWKSATGHNGDCPRYENVEAHGPLHIWSTEAPAPLQGKATWTKLQYMVAMRYAGDESMAMADLGLQRATNEKLDEWVSNMNEVVSSTNDDDDDDEFDDEDEGEVDLVQVFLKGSGVPEPFWDTVKQAAVNSRIHEAGKELAAIIAVGEKQAGRAAAAVRIVTGPDLMEIIKNPVRTVPTIGKRIDGKCFLYPGRTSVVAARPGTGKSWVSMSVASQVLSDGGRVLVLDFEDSPGLSVQRLSQIGVDVENVVKEGRLGYVACDSVMDIADFEFMMVHAENFKADFVIVDSANALISQFGAIEDNTLITKIYRRLAIAAEKSGASMLIVDHLPKNREVKSAIGAQAKQAALTGTFFLLDAITPFAPGKGGRVLLSYHEKDRLGGVAEYAIKNQVAVLRMEPSMVAPPGMDVWDGIDMTFEVIPEGGVDMSEQSPEERCLEAVIEVFTVKFPGRSLSREEARMAIGSDLREHFKKVFDALLVDEYIEDSGEKPKKYRWAQVKEIEG